jgi:hypothetical protein
MTTCARPQRPKAGIGAFFGSFQASVANGSWRTYRGCVRTRRLAVVGFAAVAAAAAWYLHTRPAATVDVTPKQPEPLGLAVGTFRGVHLGERTQAVVRTLGRPQHYGELPEPTDAPADDQIPGGPADLVSLDYPDVAVGARNGVVIWLVTTSPSAQLRHGVNVGDSLAVAERRLPRLRCSSHDAAGPDGDESGPPICQYRLSSGVNLALIGDPIRTIVIHGVRSARAAS